MIKYTETLSIETLCLTLKLAITNVKASFWGLFKTYFYGHFRKLFLFTKFEFLNFGKKFFLTVLKSTCLEFCASNYLLKFSIN